MKYIPKSEKEFDSKNPFETFIYKGKNITKQERLETIAHFGWEIRHITGQCTIGDLMKMFPTYSMKTCEEGAKYFSNAMFKAYYNTED